MKTARDDFSAGTVATIARRASYLCAHPDCKCVTAGPSEDRKGKVTIVGIAAHICAAAPLGPRYDPTMLPEERADQGNGIWLCSTHSKYIDDNPSVVTVAVLKRWKYQHERWILSQIEHGRHRTSAGILEFEVEDVGCFQGKGVFRLGRHNLVIGRNNAGKSTLCEAIAAFSGGLHYDWFTTRFINRMDDQQQLRVSALYAENSRSTRVTLAHLAPRTNDTPESDCTHKLHVEVDNCVASTWPREHFRVLHFDRQMRQMYPDEEDDLRASLKYLSSVFVLPETAVWDLLRPELFAVSTFGFECRRTGEFDVDVKVPDGRKFYLPHQILSGSELRLFVIEIALKLIINSRSAGPWLVIFDTGFISGFDPVNKLKLFNGIVNERRAKLQSIFCVSEESDAAEIQTLQSKSWTGASNVGKLVLHSFGESV